MLQVPVTDNASHLICRLLQVPVNGHPPQLSNKYSEASARYWSCIAPFPVLCYRCPLLIDHVRFFSCMFSVIAIYSSWGTWSRMAIVGPHKYNPLLSDHLIYLCTWTNVRFSSCCVLNTSPNDLTVVFFINPPGTVLLHVSYRLPTNYHFCQLIWDSSHHPTSNMLLSRGQTYPWLYPLTPTAQTGKIYLQNMSVSQFKSISHSVCQRILTGSARPGKYNQLCEEPHAIEFSFVCGVVHGRPILGKKMCVFLNKEE